MESKPEALTDEDEAIIEFFEKFIDSISTDLQFATDDISGEDTSAIGLTWNLEWKGKPFLFSKGCSFYRLDMVNGKRQTIYGRDCVKPATKPGEMVLDGKFRRSSFTFVQSRKAARRIKICMSSLYERIARGRDIISPFEVLAYDLVQGADVRWSYIMANSVPEPPTAVLLHGILGSRKNWGTFARRLKKEFPKWQFLLVDLRCHSDSAAIEKQGPHNVASAALDILKLLRQLRLTPRVIVGHSFGGKVSLSMVDQAAKPFARPVRVWVLDATPGKVRAGGDGEDHPGELISFLQTLPKEVASKRGVVEALIGEGFSKDVAQWLVTNLRQTDNLSSSTSKFSWAFDLNGIAEMYQSYEETNLWKIVEDVPRGVHINFLKAERSLHRWALKDLQRIHSAEEVAVEGGGGVEMHVLEDAGHWVHADNPDGLFKILSFSFQGI